MRKVLLIFIFFSSSFSFAQFSCPSDLIYGYPAILSNSANNSFSIIVYNPNIPPSANNPSYTSIPAPATPSTPGITAGVSPYSTSSGLALMPNLNGGQPSPTLYSNNYVFPPISGSFFTYCYWNGSTWVDTGMPTPATGLNTPRNFGGCNSAVYCVKRISGVMAEVYANYTTGSGLNQAVLLYTVSGYPYGDIVSDCNCNTYLLFPDALRKYDQSGNLLETYTSYGPNVSAIDVNFSGYGDKCAAWTVVSNTLFAVGGNTLNGFPVGLYSGVLTGNSYSLALVSANPMFQEITDFASCPISTIVSTQASINSGTLGCDPPLNLVVNATLSPLNYNWSGTGIGTSVSGGSVMSVNAAGIYTCELTQQNCDYVLATVVSTVTANTTVVTPQILPASAVCVNTEPLLSSISGGNYVHQWLSTSGNIVNSPSLAPNTAGTYTLKVTDTDNGCYGTATASILPAPQLTLGLSSNTMCVYAHDMDHVIVLTPNGAIQYSIYTSAGYTAPVIPSQPIVVQQTPPVSAFGGIGTATLVGSNGVCSSSVSANFTVLPASQISISPSITTVCKNTNQTFQA